MLTVWIKYVRCAKHAAHTTANQRTTMDSRPNSILRRPLSVFVLMAPTFVVAQQYVEWYPPKGEIDCESIAVSPEQDQRLRKHEFVGLTALRVTVERDGRLTSPIIIERSGVERDNIALDRNTPAWVAKCRLAAMDPSLANTTRRVEFHWDFKSQVPIQVK
jgi:hypothetical protein